MHMIQFPNREEHKRGLWAVLQVPQLESVGLPDLVMVVEDAHIKALKREKVKFNYLSKTAANGKKKTPVRRKGA